LFAIWWEGNGYVAAFTGGVDGAKYWNIQRRRDGVCGWRCS
jgi:hypothetical protein